MLRSSSLSLSSSRARPKVNDRHTNCKRNTTYLSKPRVLAPHSANPKQVMKLTLSTAQGRVVQSCCRSRGYDNPPSPKFDFNVKAY